MDHVNLATAHLTLDPRAQLHPDSAPATPGQLDSTNPIGPGASSVPPPPVRLAYEPVYQESRQPQYRTQPQYNYPRRQLDPVVAEPKVSELPRNSEEWKDRGAATIVKSEVDSHGNTTTRLIKKGVKDFTFGKTLGEGSYSTVVAASDRQTLRDYAIKVLDKRHIIKEKKVKYVNIEKNTLNRLGDHPGIVRLYYTFQDERSLYFVLDFAANGELLTLIKKMGSLDEECTRYYGVQLLDAIDFMHSKGVIHRDLKPENILLDYKMRIKVTDFGTAKLLDANGVDESGEPTYPENARANSFVGTAEYVPPELLIDKATGKESDLWAFGCILYQMIAGRPPFKANNEYQTFQKIVKLQYSYPPGFSFVIRDLCKKVLVINPKQRYTIPDIKNHEFFQGTDWSLKAIWKKPLPPLMPYKPSSSSRSLVQKTSVPQISNTYPRAPKNILPATAAAVALAKPQPQPQTQTQPQPQPQPQTQVSQPQVPQLQGQVQPQTQTQTQYAVRQTVDKESSGYKQPQVRQTVESSAYKPQKPPQVRPSVDKVQARIVSNRKSSSPKLPGESNQPPQLEILPVDKVDADWSFLLMSHEERILKCGSVYIVANGGMPIEDEDSGNVSGGSGDGNHNHHGKFSKLFSGGGGFAATRRKKRLLLITSAARLLIVGIEDRRLRLDVGFGNPNSVHIREYPYNKKMGMGCITIEGHHKVFRIEDPNGTGDWMRAISLGRAYYEQATRLSAANAHNAATAAALAVGGPVPSGGSKQTYSSRLQNSSTGSGHNSDHSEQSRRVINSSNSTFLQKSEARRNVMRKR